MRFKESLTKIFVVGSEDFVAVGDQNFVTIYQLLQINLE